MKRKDKQFNDSSSDEKTDDEFEQVKPYIFFSQSSQSLFDENLFLIELLKNDYESNKNYKKNLFENEYRKILLQDIYNVDLQIKTILTAIFTLEMMKKKSDVFIFI